MKKFFVVVNNQFVKVAKRSGLIKLKQHNFDYEGKAFVSELASLLKG